MVAKVVAKVLVVSKGLAKVMVVEGVTKTSSDECRCGSVFVVVMVTGQGSGNDTGDGKRCGGPGSG